MSVSSSYDFTRCRDTGKLKTLCLCDTCKAPDQQKIYQEDEAWAARRQEEKQRESMGR